MTSSLPELVQDQSTLPSSSIGFDLPLTIAAITSAPCMVDNLWAMIIVVRPWLAYMTSQAGLL